MTRQRLAGRTVSVLFALVFSLLAPGGIAQAADPWEGWPEVSAFVRLNPQMRLYLDTSYAKGKESPEEAIDAGLYLDASLKPILRPVRRQEDWARNRYLWARVGYVHVSKNAGEGHYPAEDRGVVSLYGKGELPWQVWVEGRARTDLRWIKGEYSTRYRARIEATREFTVFHHAVTPYANIEWFYDTRYDDFSRVLFQMGPEVTVDRHFRFELYVARQEDDYPKEAALNALGAVAKFYF